MIICNHFVKKPTIIILGIIGYFENIQIDNLTFYESQMR